MHNMHNHVQILRKAERTLQNVQIGDRVRARERNGLWYLAAVRSISIRRECWVRVNDDEEYLLGCDELALADGSGTY